MDMRTLKAILFIIIVLGTSGTLSAQNKIPETFTVVEQMKKGEGLGIISFIVRKTGKITDIKMLRDIGKGCGKEAARVVSLTDGMWTPGVQRGKAVNVQYNLPVRFQLTE